MEIMWMNLLKGIIYERHSYLNHTILKFQIINEKYMIP